MGAQLDGVLEGMEPPVQPAVEPRPVRKAETERTMLDRLCTRYGRTYRNGDYVGRRYVIAEHVALDPGAWAGTRIADAIVLDTWSAPHGERTVAEREQHRGGWGKLQSVHGFEVKVSRSDWLAELADPTKAEAWSRYCNYFWLVAANRDIVRGDLPEGWGLLIPHGTSLRIITAPTRRDPEPMPTPTLVSLNRGVQKTEGRIAAERALAAERTES